MASRAEITADLLVEAGDWPDPADLSALIDRAVAATVQELDLRAAEPVELSLVFTDDEAIRALNGEWRGKDTATNVLSFPAFPLRPGDALPSILGDIVFAHGTVAREAQAEDKSFADHLSHLAIHGLLHCLGYDHETDDEAEAMEEVERRSLARLAIRDPYA